MDDISKWARHYPHPHSWSFGTLIKLRALEHFIESRASTFVWVDLDVYPTDRAFEMDLPTGNVFYAPKISVDWARDHNAWHMNNKLAWWGPQSCEYYAWSTGMFSMDRDTAFHLWDWLNYGCSINHPDWWRSYYSRQLSLSAECPWDYGSDEAIKEEWLNTNAIEFDCMTDDYHSVHLNMNPVFFHYYGETKCSYPWE